MGLYMNADRHPSVYINETSLDGKNQDLYKRDFLTEWKEEQHSKFLQHRAVLENVLRQQRRLQAIQYQMIDEQSNNRKQHDKRTEEIVEEMNRFFNKMTMENIRMQAEFQKAMETQWFPIWQAAEELKDRLDKLEQLNGELANRMERQVEVQRRLAEKAIDYESSQKEVLHRLDNQEGLIDKVMRRLDHLRSILFERTHYLAEKIEAGSSSPARQLGRGSERSLTIYKNGDTREDTE
ncbi:hypothetical protein AB1K83_03600 [Sporosarcina sp. 179-K 3D1 HS]|uniref:hypothetical protein n=1 Tax=Sporosarcina sp. 179-K 3D1 HS TaxID=3232169 RepID=UPI00399EEE4D